MTTLALVGAFSLKRQHVAGSPITYTEVPEVISVSGLGQLNELIDATHFSSGGVREYISGLADGVEFTVECNFVPNSTQQEAIIAGVVAKADGNFQLVCTGSSPNVTLTFLAVYLGWTINPSVDNRNTVSFTFKISGPVTIT
jgi:hypothetical protein